MMNENLDNTIEQEPMTLNQTESVYVSGLMKKRFINYAMSVITDRALPDVRDGLKPVHRRILYAMFESGNLSSKPYKKSARMVGDVIGKYHPHGDTAVYDAAVRMAQPFSLNMPMIDGQGNFGSIDGDSPAAMRYTEMRLSKLSQEFFGSIRKDTVNWRKNYDESEQEPVSLPVSFPSILVNGSTGIAVGMACNLLPHNLNSVIDCTLETLSREDRLTTAEVMEILQAPDFPTGGMVYDLDGFAQAIETGRGTVRLRSIWHEEDRKSGTMLIIDELPYMVNKSKVVSKIAELVKSGEVEDVVGLRDESNKDGIRIAVDIKREGSAEVVFSQLATKTDLESSFSYNCMVIEKDKPKLMGLLDMIYAWNEYRQEVLMRKALFERKEALAKLHILEGLLKALNMIEESIRVIRQSSNGQEAKQGLIDLLDIDEVQSQSILDMRLQKLTSLEIDNIKADYQKISDIVTDLSFKIENPKEFLKDIISELLEIKQKFGEPRKTQIGHGMSNLTREDLITKEEVIVTLSNGGYVKRMPITSFNTQNRGTRGKRGLNISDDDALRNIYQFNTHDMLLIFDKTGQVYGTKGYSIPEGKPTDKGRHIKNVIEGFDEEIHSVMAIKESEPESCVMTITSKGQVKQTSIELYKGSTRKGGIQGVGINEEDELVASFVCNPDDHVVLVSNKGLAVRFAAKAIRASGRTSTGVRGIKLEDDGKVIGAFVLKQGEDENKFMACVSENGFGKRTSLSEFGLKGRAGKGMTAYKKTEKTGNVITALLVTENDDLVMFADNGVTNRIKVDSISVNGRATSGAKLMNLDMDSKIHSVATAPTEQSLIADIDADIAIVQED